VIEVMDESSGNILGIRATGKLTQADYHDVLGPRIELLLGQFRTLSVLFLMAEAFDSWSPGAALANTVLVLKHRRDFAKVAMVGGPKWEEWRAKKAASPLMKCEIRTFRIGQLPEAWAWLGATNPLYR
jgi:hypothetical protein